MRGILFPLVLVVLSLPVHAAGPNVLVLKHTRAEAEASERVAPYRQKLAEANLALRKARTNRAAAGGQVRAAGEKWMQERGGPRGWTPEEYKEFLATHRRRMDQMESRLVAVNQENAALKKAQKEAERAFRLARMEAQVDDPAVRLFTTGGHIWVENPESKRLDMRLKLKDRDGRTTLLITPQRIDLLPPALCNYREAPGEIWAVRGAEAVSEEGEKPAVIRIASLNQIFLMERALGKDCPFGRVAAPEAKK